MSGLFSIGTSAMFASYASLQTTGQNISNANTPGYSRQETQLETAGGQFTGAGFFGKGVRVVTVTRSSNDFLTKAANAAQATASLDSAHYDQLQLLEKVLPTGDAGVGAAASSFVNAFTDVVNSPQDASARQVVLARAGDLATRIRMAGEQLDSLQAGVTQDVKTSVASVNQLAQRIAQLNQQIAQTKGTGHEPNDLLDQRDLAVNELSKLVQVTTLPADDGTLGVFVGGGQCLVLSNQARQLAAIPDEFDPAKVQIALVEAGNTRPLSASAISGGSIAGLLKFQDEDLGHARNLLGQMAVAFAGRVNQQQSLGLDLSTPASPGAPIFSVGAPVALPGANNAKNAAGAFISSVNVSVADPTQVQASDYQLQADPATPGNYLLTRMSDGLVRSIPNGATVDGITINVPAPAPAATDRFLLQPVGNAPRNMQCVLDKPSGIAAASPVVATVGSTNTGTAAVAQLRAVSTTLNPNITTDIQFTDNLGNYSWTQTDAVTGAVTTGTGAWQPGTSIQLNGFDLALSGVPKTGDTLQVAKTQFPATNNGNALALLDLRDEAMVGRQVLASGTVVPGATITDAYASAMADIGVRVQGAKTASSISGAVSDDAQATRSNQSGVNLDEEAARMIQFQQAYQAAAKILQTAQSVFDTLLQTAAGH
ncbi:MAG TPA: flagellar hook-associated protein FlgK [Burkholderiaceae bacterium]|jgi:flagellar hook-associated protein 1 FlgK|nr:flagellar hook-associated protein FlgK [Burkholderiaceae bacterium]